MKTRLLLWGLLVAAAGFEAGRLAAPASRVRADDEMPQVDVRPVGAGTNLVVYYPTLKKMFFYQPFVGQPTWGCQYAIQLSTPGGTVERSQCGSDQ
ncbi:hypothetical protein [uncultured Paludibaculum sp.]|uniref:hypothetical protein n=1 Tax=uncultured Paludibaculum sp. TaxID=1765020 RepID=UPI002AABAC96|nr:hypothetical protein [uncultured Paludibaculum sp.]